MFYVTQIRSVVRALNYNNNDYFFVITLPFKCVLLIYGGLCFHWLLNKTELTFAKTSGTVTWDSASPITVPEVFAKSNSAQLPTRFICAHKGLKTNVKT